MNMKAINTLLATIFLTFSVSAEEIPEWEKWIQQQPQNKRSHYRQGMNASGHYDYDRKIRDAKADRIYIRKPYGSHGINVKYDGFVIIGGYYTPLDWHERIIKSLKIIEEKAPDMYRLGQTHAWKIQFNTTGPSAAAPWLNLIGINSNYFNNFHGQLLTTAIIHEFMHCNPIDGGQGAALWAQVHYAKRTDLHPYHVAYYKGLAIKHGYSEERWKRTFPNWK